MALFQYCLSSIINRGVMVVVTVKDYKCGGGGGMETTEVWWSRR